MRHLLSLIQASLEAAWLCTRHLCSSSLDWDIFESALEFPKRISTIQPRIMVWNNMVSCQGSPCGYQEWDFKDWSWKVYMYREWPAVKFIQTFLADCTFSYEQYNNIQRTTKLLTPIIKLSVTPKVLIQNEKPWWFMVLTLCNAFVQGIVRIRYPSILLLWTLAESHWSAYEHYIKHVYGPLSVNHNMWVYHSSTNHKLLTTTYCITLNYGQSCVNA